jgi:hypothetical protein
MAPRYTSRVQASDSEGAVAITAARLVAKTRDRAELFILIEPF